MSASPQYHHHDDVGPPMSPSRPSLQRSKRIRAEADALQQIGAHGSPLPDQHGTRTPGGHSLSANTSVADLQPPEALRSRSRSRSPQEPSIHHDSRQELHTVQPQYSSSPREWQRAGTAQQQSAETLRQHNAAPPPQSSTPLRSPRSVASATPLSRSPAQTEPSRAQPSRGRDPNPLSRSPASRGNDDPGSGAETPYSMKAVPRVVPEEIVKDVNYRSPVRETASAAPPGPAASKLAAPEVIDTSQESASQTDPPPEPEPTPARVVVHTSSTATGMSPSRRDPSPQPPQPVQAAPEMVQVAVDASPLTSNTATQVAIQQQQQQVIHPHHQSIRTPPRGRHPQPHFTTDVSPNPRLAQRNSQQPHSTRLPEAVHANPESVAAATQNVLRSIDSDSPVHQLPSVREFAAAVAEIVAEKQQHQQQHQQRREPTPAKKKASPPREATPVRDKLSSPSRTAVPAPAPSAPAATPIVAAPTAVPIAPPIAAPVEAAPPVEGSPTPSRRLFESKRSPSNVSSQSASPRVLRAEGFDLKNDAELLSAKLVSIRAEQAARRVAAERAAAKKKEEKRLREAAQRALHGVTDVADFPALPGLEQPKTVEDSAAESSQDDGVVFRLASYPLHPADPSQAPATAASSGRLAFALKQSLELTKAASEVTTPVVADECEAADEVQELHDEPVAVPPSAPEEGSTVKEAVQPVADPPAPDVGNVSDTSASEFEDAEELEPPKIEEEPLVPQADMERALEDARNVMALEVAETDARLVISEGAATDREAIASECRDEHMRLVREAVLAEAEAVAARSRLNVELELANREEQRWRKDLLAAESASRTIARTTFLDEGHAAQVRCDTRCANERHTLLTREGNLRSKILSGQFHKNEDFLRAAIREEEKTDRVGLTEEGLSLWKMSVMEAAKATAAAASPSPVKTIVIDADAASPRGNSASSSRYLSADEAFASPKAGDTLPDDQKSPSLGPRRRSVRIRDPVDGGVSVPQDEFTSPRSAASPRSNQPASAASSRRSSVDGSPRGTQKPRRHFASPQEALAAGMVWDGNKFVDPDEAYDSLQEEDVMSPADMRRVNSLHDNPLRTRQSFVRPADFHGAGMHADQFEEEFYSDDEGQVHGHISPVTPPLRDLDGAAPPSLQLNDGGNHVQLPPKLRAQQEQSQGEVDLLSASFGQVVESSGASPVFTTHRVPPPQLQQQQQLPSGRPPQSPRSHPTPNGSLSSLPTAEVMEQAWDGQLGHNFGADSTPPESLPESLPTDSSDDLPPNASVATNPGTFVLPQSQAAAVDDDEDDEILEAVDDSDTMSELSPAIGSTASLKPPTGRMSDVKPPLPPDNGSDSDDVVSIVDDSDDDDDEFQMAAEEAPTAAQQPFGAKPLQPQMLLQLPQADKKQRGSSGSVDPWASPSFGERRMTEYYGSDTSSQASGASGRVFALPPSVSVTTPTPKKGGK